MNRAEALAVLHEILKVCKESVIMNSVSLDNPTISSTSKSYQIKINCAFDSTSKQCIAPILEKHELFLKESEGFAVIQGI
ncbi:MAG: hypothetical protein ACXV2C_08945 [Candidatus Bathyarchaeia archaeon]